MRKWTPEWAWLFGVALVSLGSILGCGGGGSSYDVSGKVTFKGSPVPGGKIYFMPDTSKGNSGPTGYATITNGAYDTSAAGGRGVVGGPMIVAIEGVDPSAQGKSPEGASDTSGEEIAVTLFPRYETTVELPESDTTKDFEVPASAAKPHQLGEKGPPGFIDP